MKIKLFFVLMASSYTSIHAMSQEDAINRCEQGIERVTIKDSSLQSPNARIIYKELIDALNKKLRIIRASRTPAEYIEGLTDCMNGVNALTWIIDNSGCLKGSEVISPQPIVEETKPADAHAPAPSVDIKSPPKEMMPSKAIAKTSNKRVTKPGKPAVKLATAKPSTEQQ